MEILAYTHWSLNHEQADNPELEADELKFFQGLNWKPRSSAWIGLISSIMALLILSVATSAMAAFVRTNGSPVNVRTSPGGRVVGSLPNGRSISLSGRASGGWTQLSNGNWVYSRWISNSGGSGGGGGGTPGVSAYVRTDGGLLHVRSSPGGRIVGSLPNGSSISLSGRSSGGWTQLANGNWVSTRWISSSGGSAGGGGGAPSGTLQRNSSGQAVTNLQNRLKALGFYTAPITGYYGDLTEAAVRDFQRSRGIQVNGIAGPQTQTVLYSTSGGGSAGGGGGSPSTILQRGSRGSTVTNLQNRLKALGLFTGPVTGYYGELTETAVRNFQRSRRIQVNGIAGAQTQAALYGTSSGSGGGGGGTPSASLQRGSSGQAVNNLQNRLRTLGFYTASVTGYYGDVTEAAVRDFQRSRGIQINGIAGPQTTAALYSGSSVTY
ncbi:peptidoglycan-binding protein [Microcoleus sp. FACHB-53]|nr:peptidoglycan-binding protein [Microcoleus sp. FACHB-53]